MSNISGFGSLLDKGGYWELTDAQTKIGPVDVTYNVATLPSSTELAEIEEVLVNIDLIDEMAKKFLAVYSPDEFKDAQGFRHPGVVFGTTPQRFTIYYSPINPDLDLTFGVDFVNKVAVDASIGD